MTKVLITDDHQIVIEGLKLLLGSSPEIEIIGEAQNGVILLNKLKTLQPDLILLDIGMPVMNGMEAAIAVKEKYPDIKILILTTYSEQSKIKKMLKVTDGYVLKDSGKDALLNAIKSVMTGKKHYDQRVIDIVMGSYQNKKSSTRQNISLTKREKEITTLVAKGKTTKEISQALFISPLTVDTHRKNIFSKLGINKAAALVQYAIDKGLVN